MYCVAVANTVSEMRIVRQIRGHGSDMRRREDYPSSLSCVEVAAAGARHRLLATLLAQPQRWASVGELPPRDVEDELPAD
eukprot:7078639-Pyramimonas_sp.AAC.1